MELVCQEQFVLIALFEYRARWLERDYCGPIDSRRAGQGNGERPSRCVSPGAATTTGRGHS